MLEFTAALAARGVDVELLIDEGETVAILGPNGAGKSTLLSVLAGLLVPDAGSATLNGRVLFDLAARGPSRWRPPHDRGVALLAQDALLFPHLSARDNVAFGPRSGGAPRTTAGARADEWLARVGASDLAARRPAQLSGGQAQRIAVARALAADPALLLLDEPMAALDVSVAPALRRLLREVLADRTAVIVTHDVLDAYTLADRVVVLERGRVVDSGPTRAVLDRPTTPFTANLVGLDLLTGTAHGESGLLTDSGIVVASPGERIAEGRRAAIAVSPGRVSVATSRSSADNVLPGVVTDIEPRGDAVRVRAAELAADLAPGTVAALDLAVGDAVWFTFAAGDATRYPLGA
ncbi:sulfate/molybdate ABC transporter ATP-binding protein [Rathayibacter sp. VKM Ac-2754]|uniref:sulfate/molybdate ABC transporter ATP-binding protein n=1 Tax=Rathayibacter sp. VKM Ac-2754 TaxID=2609251 RepID=UPI001358358C|nr:ATP-binding cassette domain-containing protein [Rathayibacter sp. VKM Ac-2754]MWV59373.1 ATP-binding cassette domain-containing protein [Rathayibacter sp. VKM Ac-2754]